MKDLATIVRLLQDRKLETVAEATKLSKPTIISIREGRAVAPSYDTIKKLSDYFENQEAEEARLSSLKELNN